MQGERLRVLIIGGYGVFGGRLAQLLADEPRLTLIIAGRFKAKAQAFSASLLRAVRSWHLLAEGDDGPLIPSMAIEAIVRRSLDGQRPAPGARAATSDLELEDYEKSFAKRTIFTGQRVDESQSDACLYRRVLADAWDGLPEPIRNMHQLTGVMQAKGMARVERGHSVF